MKEKERKRVEAIKKSIENYIDKKEGCCLTLGIKEEEETPISISLVPKSIHFSLNEKMVKGFSSGEFTCSIDLSVIKRVNPIL